MRVQLSLPVEVACAATLCIESAREGIIYHVDYSQASFIMFPDQKNVLRPARLVHPFDDVDVRHCWKDFLGYSDFFSQRLSSY